MNTTVTIRTDKKLKAQAEQIFKMLGLNMSSAFNAFLKASIRENGMPFEMKIHEPNDETLAGMIELEALASDPNTKGFKSIKALRKSLKV